VEALKNICGVSVLPSEEYHSYEEFNIRKYQQRYSTSNETASRNIMQKKDADSSAGKNDDSAVETTETPQAHNEKESTEVIDEGGEN
jgi:hypothetical protein